MCACQGTEQGDVQRDVTANPNTALQRAPTRRLTVNPVNYPERIRGFTCAGLIGNLLAARECPYLHAVTEMQRRSYALCSPAHVTVQAHVTCSFSTLLAMPHQAALLMRKPASASLYLACRELALQCQIR
jgi:hypothetical protein